MRMKERDIVAIESAVERFNNMAMGCIPVTGNLGRNKCSLCSMYWMGDWPGECIECPIRKETGRKGCRGTPYHTIHAMQGVITKMLVDKNHIKDTYFDESVGLEFYHEGLDAIEDEIEFLISLLPDNHVLKLKTYLKR